MADAGKTQELDARQIVVFVASLSAATMAASIATIIAFVMFGIFGEGFFESTDAVLSIAAITFAGTFLGTSIGVGSSASSLRKARGPLVLGAPQAMTTETV